MVGSDHRNAEGIGRNAAVAVIHSFSKKFLESPPTLLLARDIPPALYDGPQARQASSHQQ